MTEIELIFIIIISFIYYLIKNPNKYNKLMNNIDHFINNVKNINNFDSAKKIKRSVESPNPTGENIDSKVSSTNITNIESWRDMAFVGNKNPGNYHKPSEIYSRKNLPIYYPISTPLEDNYHNYLNSISSPKLSMLRSIMHKVELYSNQGIKPIIFNYAERPIEIKKPDPNRIKVLADTIINLINKFGDTHLKTEMISTNNVIHEETDQESRICFDLKIKFYYADYEKMGQQTKFATLHTGSRDKKNHPQYDIIYIQPEFVFQKMYNKLPEDQFFDKNIKADFRAYLSKLIIIGSENMGFLAGPESKRGVYGLRRSKNNSRFHKM